MQVANITTRLTANEIEALIARLRQYRGRLPTDFKFDRHDANAR